MNKKAARYGLYFYLITMLIAFIFPAVFENVVVLACYLVACLVFLYFIYFKNRKNESK
jgi:Ca2+/Na+ antiporter